MAPFPGSPGSLGVYKVMACTEYCASLRAIVGSLPLPLILDPAHFHFPPQLLF